MRRRIHPAVLVAAVVPPILLALAAGAFLLYKFGPKPKSTPTVLTRAEFTAAVMGKTPDEVIARFGRPEFTEDHPAGFIRWTYSGVCMDPISGKVDTFTAIDFADGRVFRVP